jgi:hypothetical protein
VASYGALNKLKAACVGLGSFPASKRAALAGFLHHPLAEGVAELPRRQCMGRAKRCDCGALAWPRNGLKRGDERSGRPQLRPLAPL